jgi:3-oxoacyl-[acyl-carrier-protein] synthase-3
MEATSIERVAAYVPETTVSVHELADTLGLTPTQRRVLTRFMGLDRVAVAEDMGLADLLCAAANGVLADADRDSVRYLIHAHTMQHVAVGDPRLLDEVRERLGLPAATAFSMSHINCVVGLHALHVARCLLAGAEPGAKALVLTGDKVIEPRTRLIPDITVQGDASAACLVGSGPGGDRVMGRALRVEGRFYQCLDCPRPLLEEYKRTYVDYLSETMRAAIADTGCKPADISLVLPHNVNRMSWKRVLQNVGIPDGRIYLDNVGKTGHCYSSDPFINLATARSCGRLHAGELVLLVAAGLGAAFAATVVEIGEGRIR